MAIEPLVLGDLDHTAQVWACQDCMIAYANGDISPDRPADLPPVLGLVDRPDRVSMGGTHSDQCGEDDRAEGCDCGDGGFMQSSCDLCGDSHHGDRYRFTWWFTQSELDQQNADTERWIAARRAENPAWSTATIPDRSSTPTAS